MKLDLVIRGGTLVGPTSQYPADIGVEGGRIATIASRIDPGDAECLDAQDLFVLPGLVDLHTHLGSGGNDDVASGTRAAAWGGVTTVIDFAYQQPGGTLVAAFEERLSDWEGRSHVDYGLHVAPCEWNEATRREIRELVSRGVPSFKFHQTAGCVPQARALDDSALLELLSECAKFGATVMLHAGNPGITRVELEALRRDSLDGFEYWGRCHPVLAESEGIGRAAALARHVEGNLFVFSVSGGEAAQSVGRARQDGVNVSAETAPHYLLASALDRADPACAVHPPLRDDQDSGWLWHALQAGEVQTVSSNHRCSSLEAKKAGGRELARVEPGLPELELTLPLLFSEGVRRGRLSLSRLVQLTASNPAAVAGLFPRKGILQVGSDADLVILDPEKDWTVTSGALHMPCDYSPFEGLELRGAVVATVLRGHILRQRDELLAAGEPARGQFQARSELEEVY